MVKVDVGSTNFRKVYSMSLLLHMSTYSACTHAYIPLSQCCQLVYIYTKFSNLVYFQSAWYIKF